MCAILIRTPMSPIGVLTWATSSSTITSAWCPARGRTPAVCFSKAERSPRSLPDTVIWTPMAPFSMTWLSVHMVALLNAVPRSRCAAILLHITLGESSGTSISVTETCGFFRPKLCSRRSVSSRMPVPLRPITMPGRVTCSAMRVPVGVFDISACEKPASFIACLR